jgi:hypothetical protein
MFHHNNKKAPDSPIVSPRVQTVRLLTGPEELQAAVERARTFERRRVDEYQRRVGAYDRFFTADEVKPAIVVQTESSASVS